MKGSLVHWKSFSVIQTREMMRWVDYISQFSSRKTLHSSSAAAEYSVSDTERTFTLFLWFPDFNFSCFNDALPVFQSSMTSFLLQNDIQLYQHHFLSCYDIQLYWIISWILLKMIYSCISIISCVAMIYSCTDIISCVATIYDCIRSFHESFSKWYTAVPASFLLLLWYTAIPASFLCATIYSCTGIMFLSDNFAVNLQLFASVITQGHSNPWNH